jgi:hypothetical protein
MHKNFNIAKNKIKEKRGGDINVIDGRRNFKESTE